MAYLLNAEQKSLSVLFSGGIQFIIPSYQRPYSWDIENCRKLYEDVISAYNEKRDYFLGNIIMAVSDETAYKPRVVDGQQRLITIWLLFKSLSVILPSLKVLRDALCIYNWDGTHGEQKVSSLVFESNDDEIIKGIFNWEESDFEEKLADRTFYKNGQFLTVKNSNLIINCLFFYKTFKDFLTTYGHDKLVELVKYILGKVSMLPIEMRGSSLDEAEGKALTIFETINNRGMNLEDADIFKAMLYNKAISKNQKEEFVRQWADIKDKCVTLKMSIDDLFRYYSHIIRGNTNNTKNEISLREFFTGTNSVLSQKGSHEVMDDLNKIISLIEEFNNRKVQNTVMAKWLQLVDIYTNAYPKYAVITYLFHYGFENETELISLLQKIVRYCFYMGATTTVKYGIYNIIRQVSKGIEVDNYYQTDVTADRFDDLGRLKFGYALLAQYLGQESAFPWYEADRLLTKRDEMDLPKDWRRRTFADYVDDLGNIIIIDVPRKYAKYKDKVKAYQKTENQELRLFLSENPDTLSFKAMDARGARKKTLLVNFFKPPKKH